MYICDINTRRQANRQASCWSTLESLSQWLLFGCTLVWTCLCAPHSMGHAGISGTSLAICWYIVQDPKEALELGERWQDAIEELCDAELLFRQANPPPCSLHAARPLQLWDTC